MDLEQNLAMDEGHMIQKSDFIATDTEITGAKTASLWRNQSFMSLWVGQFIACLGNSVYSLALMWEMSVLTGSTVMMSTISMATVIPMIVLGPISGVLVDRWPKRIAMMLSDVVRACIIILLTVLLVLHMVAPWMLIAGAALNAIAGSVYSPANMAIVPMMVEKEQLQQANSFSQGGMIIAQLVGPFLGGILVAHVSMTAAFFANALGFLASVVSLILVTHREPQREKKPFNVKQAVVEFKEGLAVIRDIEILRSFSAVALITNFIFAPFELVFIQYSKLVLHGGAQMYGDLGAAFSAGMLVGSILCGILSKVMKKGTLIILSFPLMSIMMVGIAFTHNIVVAMILTAMMGIFLVIINILAGTVFQTVIPQEKMGRVGGSLGMLMQGSQPFAQGFTGYLLSTFSVPVLMGAMGILQTLNSVYTASKQSIRSLA